MTTVRELIKRLGETYNLDDHVATIVWVAEDVVGKAKDMGHTLTTEEANEIIETIDRQSDAELGICWMTLEVHIDFFIENRNKNPKLEL